MAVRNPKGDLYYVNTPDSNDGKEWSFADMDALRLHFETGGKVGGAAVLLYRRGTIEEVRQKAIELGLIK